MIFGFRLGFRLVTVFPEYSCSKDIVKDLSTVADLHKPDTLYVQSVQKSSGRTIDVVKWKQLCFALTEQLTKRRSVWLKSGIPDSEFSIWYSVFGIRDLIALLRIYAATQLRVFTQNMRD